MPPYYTTCLGKNVPCPKGISIDELATGEAENRERHLTDHKKDTYLLMFVLLTRLFLFGELIHKWCHPPNHTAMPSTATQALGALWPLADGVFGEARLQGRTPVSLVSNM